MSDQAAVQQDLHSLAESLRGTTASVRSWARQVQEESGARAVPLARQLDRAARLLDQAVRALREPNAEEARAELSAVPGLTGSTQAVPLSSLVSFLAGVHASGVLRIYTADESYVLQFEHGYLIYAFGDNPPQGTRLGEVLVAQGAIRRADLLRVLYRGWSTSETLGGRLVDDGHVRPEQLLGALEFQIHELGKRLFSNDDARFRFYPGEHVIRGRDVRMNVMGLLLESARARDEAQQRVEDPWASPQLDQDVA